MEIEEQNVKVCNESTETSTLIPQAETADMDHEFITFKATDLVNTTELNVAAGTPDHSTLIQQSDIDDMQPEATTIKETEPMTTTESNIDAAISGDVKAEGAAANDYDSSDLDSSDDEDEVTEKRVATADDSSSEDSDEDSDDDMQLPTKSMSIEEREKALIDISWMDDEDGSNTNAGEPLRTKNEIKDIVVQRPTITIKPEAKIVEIGTIYAVVENTVVVQGHVSGDEQVLDSGSLFVFEDRDILGEIFETFGPVAKPLYSVRFNDASEIDVERTKQGAKVYIVSDLSTYVLTRALKMQKGSDASNFFDEEVDENEMAFSDDEAELAFKRQQKQKRGKKRPAEQQERPQPAAEPTWEDLDGYNVLKRPTLPSNAPPQRRPHPLPPRPTLSMIPATAPQENATPQTHAVHTISQLFAAGPPPLHPPPRDQ
ncbi:unnamed protein product [Umbelopsis vinacea]